MTNDDLNKIKSDLRMINLDINKFINNMNNCGNNLAKIDINEKPEEFQEAAILYSEAKNTLTTFLLSVVDSLGMTLIDVIEYVQSSPKAKLWTPDGVR